MIKNKHRALSYLFGLTFILSLVLISFTSLALINNYRENKELNSLMEKIKMDYSEEEEDYYPCVEKDEDIIFKNGDETWTDFVSFPNTNL